MSLKVKSSFSAGELDPALHERTTLNKYQTGLAKARNVIVSKNGSILSRMGRRFYGETKHPNSPVVLYAPPVDLSAYGPTGVLLEVGVGYLRMWGDNLDAYGNFGASVICDVSTPYTADDLPKLHFETSGWYVYIFCQGKSVEKFRYDLGVASDFIGTSSIFALPGAPDMATQTNGTTAPTGYDVDYQLTMVKAGQESTPVTVASGKVPIVNGQSSHLMARVNIGSNDPTITEMRVYRRPRGAGAFGFIGSTTASSMTGSDMYMRFDDIGQSADYTNSPPQLANTLQVLPGAMLSKTGIIYQQRLIITDQNDLEALYASRPGFQNNFLRDYPLAADSALKFKAGTSGFARVLRMIDADGLVVFTTAGVFLNTGALGPTNLTLVRKGRWKISDAVPPVAIPGGVLFVDSTSNTFRNLVWSTELAGYNGQEVSIYSNHLFQTKKITSAAFHEGQFPLLWVTFDDGTYASFTYEFDQEMRAWTRHDSFHSIEQVASTGLPDRTFFLCRRGTRRHIELTIPRAIPAAAYLTNPEVERDEYIAAMDTTVTWRRLLNVFGGSITLAPIAGPPEPDPAFITGPMTLTTANAVLKDVGGSTDYMEHAGQVGQVYRYFDPITKDEIDLEITARASDTSVTVQPSLPFPVSHVDPVTGSVVLNTVNPRLYLTRDRIDLPAALASISIKNLSMIVDGYVVGSPNNDIEGYPTITPNATVILPAGRRGAIIHVGWGFTADTETLDVDTVEQAPTLVESITCNKLMVKVLRSSGLYVGARFPASDKVLGMQSLDEYRVDYAQVNPIIGNRYMAPFTDRVELTLPGDWKSQGRICIRQVDPLHFQVLSLIPDLSVNTRSDR